MECILVDARFLENILCIEKSSVVTGSYYCDRRSSIKRFSVGLKRGMRRVLYALMPEAFTIARSLACTSVVTYVMYMVLGRQAFQDS